MPDHIRELLHRNLQEVFGEGNAAHRRAAIESLYTEDCVLYAPPGIFVGPEALDKFAGDLRATHPHFVYTPAARPRPSTMPGGWRWDRGRAASRPTIQAWMWSSPRWKDRGALCVPRSRTVVEGDLFAGAACGAVKPRPSSRPLWVQAVQKWLV